VPSGKSFDIPKMLIWEAYRKVQANKGAAGVDGQSLSDFGQDEKKNLYKIWNRMSSGTYFPPPVRAVEIPKPGGTGVRVLGVPTVADRIAQTAVAMVLEPGVEQVFHPDSYGYRPGRSALDAVGQCRRRCWRDAWVIDLDIKAFFDTVPHEKILAAVDRHTVLPWVRLYVRRWLCAPTLHPDGSLQQRERGTPQGSAISPLLANLFMHYAFDRWLASTRPGVGFERYCDDVIVHCHSQRHAQVILAEISARMAEFGLEVHPDKTRIVFCRQQGRVSDYPVTAFTFLGYDFRPRQRQNKTGQWVLGFLPAVSKRACKAMSATIRSWRLGRCTSLNLEQLATMINRIVSGWINYYGRFYKSLLIKLLRDRINPFLVKWAQRKYKRLHQAPARARQRLARIARTNRDLFIHWAHGAIPTGATTGAV